MLRSIDLSRAGMLRQQQFVESVAHNIANTATPGFKAVRVALESGDVPATDAGDTGGAGAPGLTGQLQTGRLLTQGTLRPTTNMTDFAIEGEGYFTVMLADGTEAYTRNGAFLLDSQRRLTDGAGNPVQPPMALPPGAYDLRVDEDGTVSARVPGGLRQRISQIQIARFPNPQGLSARADGMFVPTPGSGPAQMLTPGQNGIGIVRNSMIEESNSELTQQLTNLVAAQRAFQLNSSAFRMSDEMLRIANSLQGNS